MPEATSLAYLPDTARLEWAVNEVRHAPDAKPLDLRRLGQLDAADMQPLSFAPSVGVQVLQAAFPVDAIWHAVLVQNDSAFADINLTADPVRLYIHLRAALRLTAVESSACSTTMDTVSASALCCIQCTVGSTQCHLGIIGSRKFAHASRERIANERSSVCANLAVTRLTPESLNDVGRIASRCSRKNNQKFFSPSPTYLVRPSCGESTRVRTVLQHGIPSRVAIGVVYALEAVQINQSDCDRNIRVNGRGYHLFEVGERVPSICETSPSFSF